MSTKRNSAERHSRDQIVRGSITVANPLTRRGVIAGAVGLLAGAAGGNKSRARDRREEIVSDLLGEMGLRERIGQMFVFQADQTVMPDWYRDLLEHVRPGGIIFVQPNIGTADQIKRYIRAIHRSNKTVPPFVAIDQEGGDVVRISGDPAPGAIELGKLGPDDARAKARDRARFLAGFGFDVNFAPVADVAYKPTSSMYLRSFGSDPHLVAETVAQVVRGSRQLDVMGAAKHFPGHGRTTIDSHVKVPQVTLTWNQWKTSDGLPFRAAIDAGVEMVMVGHLRYPEWDDQPMSLSKVAVSKLRKNLAYDRVILTDDLGMGALSEMDPYEVLDRAVDSGMDMLLYTKTPAGWQHLIDHVEHRVRAGDVARKRIDESVRRILRMKVDHFRLKG